MSIFKSLQELAPDPIFGLTRLFNNDPRTFKVNLSVGVYQDEDAKVPVFGCIREAEKRIFENKLLKNYQPIEGSSDFFKVILKLVFGDDLLGIDPGRFTSAQAIGGTGALRLGGEFLKRLVSENLTYSNPSWPIHHLIFKNAGFTLTQYPYLVADRTKISFEKWVEHLNGLPAQTVVLLHGCCHNPSGIDPTKEQWQILSKVIAEKKLIPFFDLAYQGFGEGIEEDAYPVRLFAKEGHELFAAVSFSKNLGLYGERAGALVILNESEKIAKNVMSQLQPIIRSIYSNPPLTSARLVQTVLSDHELTTNWHRELKTIRNRINELRLAFCESMHAKIPNFPRLPNENERGMFSFCQLNPKEVQSLQEQFGIYMTDNGRINLAGLNSNNLEYVSESIAKVINSK